MFEFLAVLVESDPATAFFILAVICLPLLLLPVYGRTRLWVLVCVQAIFILGVAYLIMLQAPAQEAPLDAPAAAPSLELRLDAPNTEAPVRA